MESTDSPRPGKARQAKIKAKSILIISFDIKAIIHKEFVLAGLKKSILHSTVTFYCMKLRENMRRLRPELWRRRNLLLHTDSAPSNTSFLTLEFVANWRFLASACALCSIDSLIHPVDMPLWQTLWITLRIIGFWALSIVRYFKYKKTRFGNWISVSVFRWGGGGVMLRHILCWVP
jgi:hypothetical protein